MTKGGFRYTDELFLAGWVEFKQRCSTAVDFEIEIPLISGRTRAEEEFNAAVLVDWALVLICQGPYVAVLHLKENMDGVSVVCRFELCGRKMQRDVTHMVGQFFGQDAGPGFHRAIAVKMGYFPDFRDDE